MYKTQCTFQNKYSCLLEIFSKSSDAAAKSGVDGDCDSDWIEV